jgi:MFS family permease
MAPVVLPTNLSREAPDALEAAGSLMVTSFQVAISIGAVVGGYVVDTYGATGPLTVTAVLAASTVAVGAAAASQLIDGTMKIIKKDGSTESLTFMRSRWRSATSSCYSG